MKDKRSDLSVQRNPERRRFEALVGGRLAGHLDYRERGGALDLVHTEVAPEFEGRGIASSLVQHVLDRARGDRGKVVPSCSYVQAFIERHPQYADIAVD